MRPKARSGECRLATRHHFSDDTRAKLRALYPHQADACPPFGHPADEFVELLLVEGYWLAGALRAARQFRRKEELRFESDALLKDLRGAHMKLINLSTDFDNLLGLDADPRGLADSIALMIKHSELAQSNITSNYQVRRPPAWRHWIALDFAGRVAILLRSYDINPSATASTYLRVLDITQNKNWGTEDTSEYVSDAVKILKIIADDVGLELAEATWRDTLAKARKQS